jgi:hypothetical protein
MVEGLSLGVMGYYGCRNMYGCPTMGRAVCSGRTARDPTNPALRPYVSNVGTTGSLAADALDVLEIP